MGSRREFLRAQAVGVRVETRHFILLLALSPVAFAPARLGITVTRKVGCSVQRNRVRRVVREAFRLDRSFAPDGIDVVVIAKQGAPALGLADVQAEWQRIRGLVSKRAKVLLAAPTAPSPPAP